MRQSSWPKTTLKSVLTRSLIAFVAVTAQAAEPSGSATEKAATCAGCHGVDGKSIAPEIPNLAAQHAGYLALQLKAFKSGARKNEVMGPMAANLSDEDMTVVSDYFAAKPAVRGTADPKLAKDGERLYRGGRQESHTPACMACHGPAGHGNPSASYPSLGGQHAAYTAAQLKAYRSGQRGLGAKAPMQAIAKSLNDNDIDALASYIEGLGD